MVMTIAEFAKAHGTDVAVAGGVIKFLVGKGLVKEAGKRPAERGFGRASNLYEIPNTVTLELVKQPEVAAA